VPFSECLKVINQYAFVASPYPVIITIENHLPPDLQRQAAMVGFSGSYLTRQRKKIKMENVGNNAAIAILNSFKKY
jgi:hypothetical protein